MSHSLDGQRDWLEMSTLPTPTSQGELFDAAVASAHVTLCSIVGTSLLLCIRAPADNIKSLVLRRPTPLPRDGLSIAGVRVESESPAYESVHLRLDYVLTTELNYSRRNPSLKPQETREDDDRRYVATKLVNIAQCLDRSLSKADCH
jgi:hypothetical protein